MKNAHLSTPPDLVFGCPQANN